MPKVATRSGSVAAITRVLVVSSHSPGPGYQFCGAGMMAGRAGGVWAAGADDVTLIRVGYLFFACVLTAVAS